MDNLLLKEMRNIMNMENYSIKADIIDKINDPLEFSNDTSTNRFKSIRFINKTGIDRTSLPTKYGKVETLDDNGKIEIQIFNNSWFSRDYNKKVIAWRYINKTK